MRHDREHFGDPETDDGHKGRNEREVRVPAEKMFHALLYHGIMNSQEDSDNYCQEKDTPETP